jgi:hypothetical protein
MVLDGIAIATTAISLMMNGFCCMWQQQEEKKMREAIRHDIRTENGYHRQNMMTEIQMQLINRQTMNNNHDNDEYESSSLLKSDDTIRVQEERRRKLMMAKMNIVLQTRNPAHEDTLPKCGPRVLPCETIDLDRPPKISSLPTIHPDSHCTSPADVHHKIIERMKQTQFPSASLMDNCDSDYDTEEINSINSSFMDICLD